MKLSVFSATIVIVFLILSSCKKEYTCSHKIQYFAPTVSFVGFSETEIKDICIAQYKSNTGFTDLIRIDTLSEAIPLFMGDTAYSKIEPNYANGFVDLNVGIDYKVKQLTTGQEFIITDVKSGPETKTWTQEDYCSPGAGQMRFSTLSYKLNGVDLWPSNLRINRFVMFLHH